MARRNSDFYSNPVDAQVKMWLDDHPLVPIGFDLSSLPYPEHELIEIKRNHLDRHSKSLVPYLKGHCKFEDMRWVDRIRPSNPQLGYAIDLVTDLPTDMLIQVIGAQLAELELCPAYVICRVNGREMHRIKWPPAELEKMHLRVKRRREVKFDKGPEQRLIIQVVKDYLLGGDYPRRGLARGCAKDAVNEPHIGKISQLLGVPRPLVSAAVVELGDSLTA